MTDKDGDKATSERDISHSISIDDDGPKADLIKLEVDKGGDGKLVHDETAGVQNGRYWLSALRIRTPAVRTRTT